MNDTSDRVGAADHRGCSAPPRSLAQHVVDLCDRGDMLCVRVGSHRRVPQAELDLLLGAMSAGGLTRDEERSLWLHRAVLAALVTDPDGVVARARANLDRLAGQHAARGMTGHWMRGWAAVLDPGVDAVADTLVLRSQAAIELRQNSPFAGCSPKRSVRRCWRRSLATGAVTTASPTTVAALASARRGWRHRLTNRLEFERSTTERRGDMAGRTPPALVEPSLLVWARLSIGLTPEQVAARLPTKLSKLTAWESGDDRPTIAQLRKLAVLYKRPLAVFFLPEPPQGFDALHDFRRLADTEVPPWSPQLHGEFRRATSQRDVALEVAELSDEPIPVRWLEGRALSDDTEQAGEAIREQLMGAVAQPKGDEFAHLASWINALEDAGVLVIHTEGVDLREMRGFSIYEDVLPVVAVNGSDFPRGRLFSLMHEFAHLRLNSGGLCDQITDRRALTAERQLEARCNAIAAATLMPRAMVRSHPLLKNVSAPRGWDSSEVRAVATAFGVSEEAMLRRFVTLGYTTQAHYDTRRKELRRVYAAELQRRKDEAKLRSGGPNYYTVRARNLGKGYVRLVLGAYGRHVIDTYTAADFLNAKVQQLERLGEAASSRAGL